MNLFNKLALVKSSFVSFFIAVYAGSCNQKRPAGRAGYPYYRMPSIDLLNKITVDEDPDKQEKLHIKAMKLEEMLQSFGVDAKVSRGIRGAAVTRFEIQPNTGVKVSSIFRLCNEMAQSLEAKSIRMEAPISEKTAVGVEVENDCADMVGIREILCSTEFKTAKSKISLAIGKDIEGNAIVADLKGMPHLLIAGFTGGEKSMCLNSLIISILYKAKPNEVKFVIIDSQIVGLSNYNGIPHLLIPVITDPLRAVAALDWAVTEMTDRYRKFAEEGVRDLTGYNAVVRAKGEDVKFMHQVVLIINELADLMMAVPSQTEQSICCLLQTARAAGMHLIIATQRLSDDIITDNIKANMPSRIAFAVSSQGESRTILGMAGAEKLAGNGDMLFWPLGIERLLRVQGCFVSDCEVHTVIEYLKNNGPKTEYEADVMNFINMVQPDEGVKDIENDKLLEEGTGFLSKSDSFSM